MRFSETKKYQVMSTDTATTVGVLSDFVVDPRTATVVALRLTKSAGAGDTLQWQDLTAFGADVITIPSHDVLTAPSGRAAELIGGDSRIVGKRVLTDAGREIGTVTDVEFDPTDGSITDLITHDEPIHGTRLLGIGSYAVVVRNDD